MTRPNTYATLALAWFAFALIDPRIWFAILVVGSMVKLAQWSQRAEEDLECL